MEEMRNKFEIPAAPLAAELGERPPNAPGWRGTFLGAAVGIAGPSYFGTLFSNVTLWVLIKQGRSTQEAYAYLFQFNWSFPVVANLAADIFFSVACGWVAAAYGRGVPILQGVTAGLLTVSFPVIMLMSPAAGPMPLLFRAMALAIPVLGSVVGAYAFSRRS